MCAEQDYRFQGEKCLIRRPDVFRNPTVCEATNEVGLNRFLCVCVCACVCVCGDDVCTCAPVVTRPRFLCPYVGVNFQILPTDSFVRTLMRDTLISVQIRRPS